MRSGKGYDLVVVGGGIIGLGVAREAALRGMQVVVLDQGRPGGGATEAAAGMLSPLAESSESGPFLEAGLASLALYPEWVAALEAGTGMPTGFRTDGKLRVAQTAAGVEALRALAARSRAVGPSGNPGGQGVDPDADPDADPCVDPHVDPGTVNARLGVECAPVLAALHLGHDGQVDPRRLHAALLAHTLELGVEVRDHTRVTALVESGGRVEGVRAEPQGGLPATSPAVYRAGQVLLAAGAWSGSLAVPGTLPVRPVRGQMLALDAGPHLPSQVVESESVYLVPRQDGRLLVGATVEEVGFQAGCTVEARRELLDAAARLIPGLAHVPVLEQWAGLRPGTPDGHPVLGKVPGRDGLLVATGHYRNGILLAPWTAQALARILVGGRGSEGDGPVIPRAFGPDRFGRPLLRHRAAGTAPPVAPAGGSE